MKKLLCLPLLVLVLTVKATPSNAAHTLELKTASNHPMQYYVSLPNGWDASRSWPVMVVLEAAEKEFKKNAQRFVDARGNAPFIIVAPINTNNGNQGRRDNNLFPYSKETWDYMDKVGDCQFNDEGIIQVIEDVKKLYHGEGKVYITGFEAGAHALWSMVFNHGEYLRAAAPVAGNFRNRCVTEGSGKEMSGVADVPIRTFFGEGDQFFGPGGSLYSQWQDAKSKAIKAGYKNIEETLVKGKDHAPLPDEVMNYFGSLIKK